MTTQTGERPRSAAATARTGERTRLGVLALTVEAAAVAVWLLWARVGGVDLVVGTGDSRREIGLGAVGVVTALVTGAALALRWLLRRRTHSMRTWTVVAAVVWAVSFLGPSGAATTAAGLGLATLHLVVGGGILFGVRAANGGPGRGND
ncbi:MAG: DUF6069 family protein [Marmoricola sp.]